MLRFSSVLAIAPLLTAPLLAQTLPTADPVLQRIWTEGTTRSQVESLMQTLTDSIGPRLTGSPRMNAGQDWLVATYRKWGIAARKERYGTWLGWRRGITHLDLLEPRVRSLEATMLAWSPGTGGRAVEAEPIILADQPDSARFAEWLPNVKGKLVLLSQPMPSCRPDSAFRAFALPATYDRLIAERTAAQEEWTRRLEKTGYSIRELPKALERAGAAGILTSLWSLGWGVTKIFRARTEKVPTVDLSCEDYGLVFRLTERGQGPRLRLEADAAFDPDTPVFNVIGEIRGSEKPNEYVMLSAHFDSWDGASGATDNGTGTITMLEAMRILAAVAPRPKRTILVGHWSGEEQGLNGSRAFVQDHPEVILGLQALFNQDNGTGRVVNLSASGLVGAGGFLANWLSKLPTEITRNISTFGLPGSPPGGGSDHASFICAGAPAFGLGSLSWEYGMYTWHTNRDTFDKVVFDDLRNNAVLTASLAYLASEDPNRVSRDRRIMPETLAGPGRWPVCQAPARSMAESRR